MAAKQDESRPVLASQVRPGVLLLKSLLGVDEVGALRFLAGADAGDGRGGLIIVDVFVVEKVEEVRLLIVVLDIEDAVVLLADARSYWHLEADYMYGQRVETAPEWTARPFWRRPF